ncbi:MULTISPECIES: ABC transporter ATP-binding protein [unclassified Janthinobacterium]|uniref:ABC transporter ATP-binding protein n=1 Tax=unclassified Janthinobacterium TaxID=2610881 RepID=UPI000C70CCC3|nr:MULTISPECIES: ABC transporter ATP-binding protein [unclassified Janthinobacterium]PKV46398.1 ABC-2 type transport system ATP-binding protein [Janthinobacterium sp. 61]TDY33348.1 ABC-2 type transport system ATP-binding protein [Janthinobacterium sp. 75]
MTNEPILQTDKLSLRFKDKHALDQLSLRVARGGIHAIVGANGAGKSSLFRVLLGFEAATEGSARILGCDCARLTPDLRGRIGYVNEEHTLPLWLTIGELTAMQRRLYTGWNEERYCSVLRNFNVLPGQRIAQLSRGERAGVNLALALGQSPELLILDEPTLGLDVVAKRLFLGAMMESSYSDDMTIIYCSHQMEEIERVADQLIILERGRLLQACAPDVLCERVLLWVAEFPFLPPDTRALPGILHTEHIDGLSHFMVLDQGPEFAARLRLLGARSVHNMPVSLDRAINALLARGHISSANPALHAA